MVYVINKDGKTLMPTTRHGHIRWLLKNKQARVVDTKPFTIQLLYEVENKTQPLTLGIDPGRTNIGLSVTDEKGKELFSATVESRNKDVTKLMTERKMHRQASRRGRRLRRQRRAVKNGTVFVDTEKERYLPHYEEPITVHYIKNKQSKFCNRKRPEGWLTPTVNHCVQTHINLVNKISKFLPITNISIEVNVFDFQLLENPYIKNWQYQKGTLFGYKDVFEYISDCQDDKCLLCGNKIEHYHHIVPRSNNGSNTHENLVGLCNHCHILVHTNEEANKTLLSKKEGLNKKYAGSSVLNTAMPFIIKALFEKYSVWCTIGKRTKAFRVKNNITKTHALDAYCIACDSLDNVNISLQRETLSIKQYRRHDRAYIHKANYNRKYYLNNELVCTNRHKAMEQKDDSLEEYRNKLTETMGKEAIRIISKLIVKEHKSQHKDINRPLPGSLVKSEDIFILKRTDGRDKKHNPNYYISEQNKKYKFKNCSIIKNNSGLVIMK